MRLTPFIFGDPPYNRSALAMKRGEYWVPPPPAEDTSGKWDAALEESAERARIKEMKRRNRIPKNIPLEKQELIIQLRKSGAMIKEIVKEAHIAREGVRWILESEGIE